MDAAPYVLDCEAVIGDPVVDRADWPANADPSWQAVDRYYGKRD